jgi:hypothetical protein
MREKVLRGKGVGLEGKGVGLEGLLMIRLSYRSSGEIDACHFEPKARNLMFLIPAISKKKGWDCRDCRSCGSRASPQSKPALYAPYLVLSSSRTATLRPEKEMSKKMNIRRRGTWLVLNRQCLWALDVHGEVYTTSIVKERRSERGDNATWKVFCQSKGDRPLVLR